jgi:hypothetical protein
LPSEAHGRNGSHQSSNDDSALVGVDNLYDVKWFRQEGEGEKAYHAFSEYRDMGKGRNYRKTAAKVGKSYSLMCMWGAKYSWDERSTAYDRYMDEERFYRRQEQAEAALDEHVTDAIDLRVKAMNKIRESDIKQWSVAQAIQAIKVSVDIERYALGVELKQKESASGAGALAGQPNAESQMAALEEKMNQDPELAIAAATILEAVRRGDTQQSDISG